MISDRFRRTKNKYSFLSRADDILIDQKKIEYAINMLRHNEILDELGFDYIYRILSQESKTEFFEKFRIEATEMGDVEDLHREIPGKFAEFALCLSVTVPGFHKFITGLLKCQISSLKASRRKSILCKRLTELKTCFNLGEMDLESLTVLYLVKEDNILNESFGFMDLRREARKKLILANQLTGIPSESISECLGENGKLRRYGLIYDDLELTEHIQSYLSGFGGATIKSSFFIEFQGESVPLSCHETVKEHTAIVRKIILGRKPKDGVNILLHGAPGTGKTEYGRSLATALNRRIYEVRHMEEKKASMPALYFRLASISACQNSVDTELCITIIDEADELLNGRSEVFFQRELSNPNKGAVNSLLDCSKGVSIWITNSIAGMEESTRRRFDYVVEFKKLSLETKKHIWTSCTGKYELQELVKSEEIDRLAAAYDVSVGGIEITLRNMRRIMNNDASAEQDPITIIDSLLKSHVKIVSGGKSMAYDDLPVANYSVEGLNILGLSAEKTIQILNKFCDSGKSANSVRNVNLLLMGAPGTGKTEFAKYVAKELKKKLTVKRGSDILSMWVGGSEKLIRDAFAEAERDDAILFIDEADGLITERGNASRNWEVTQTNEFLGQMENFRGIMICATNFKRNMDSASIRRFHIKLEFDYLADDGKKIFYNRYFGDGGGAQEKWKALQAIKCLTPGDFRNVRQRLTMLGDMPADAWGIISELQNEVAMKNEKDARKIGF